MEEIKNFTQEIDLTENSSLKRIGNFIKEERLSRNQSIEELASNLKLGGHQLKAIEDGDEENLPEEVFVKAMIRRISEKLKLDTEFIMSEFKNESKEGKQHEFVEEVSNKSQPNREAKNSNHLVFVMFVIISGFFGLISSSLIFNLFSGSFQNQIPIQELIRKTR